MGLTILESFWAAPTRCIDCTEGRLIPSGRYRVQSGH
jgi:hypothetical protein